MSRKLTFHSIRKILTWISNVKFPVNWVFRWFLWVFWEFFAWVLILLEFFGLEFIFQMRNDKPELNIPKPLKQPWSVRSCNSTADPRPGGLINSFWPNNSDSETSLWWRATAAWHPFRGSFRWPKRHLLGPRHLVALMASGIIGWARKTWWHTSSNCQTSCTVSLPETLAWTSQRYLQTLKTLLVTCLHYVCWIILFVCFIS